MICKTLFATLLFLCSFNSSPAQNGPFIEDSIAYKQQKFSMQEVLQRYLRIPSVSGKERQAGEFLQQLCAENGLHITPMGQTDGNYNFAASIAPLSDRLPNIILLNHLDVVPTGDTALWTHPPFSGRVVDGNIWGRGAFDNKGPAVIQLFSIIETAYHYAKEELPYNVTFLTVSCEETQCKGGIPYVVEHYLDELNPIVVIGEGPPSIDQVLRSDPDQVLFGISVAHKRPLWLQLELTVETIGHGSVTPIAYANREMVSALDRLLKRKRKVIYNDINVELLKQLGDLEKGINAFALKHPRLFRWALVPEIRKQPELLALFTNTITLTSLDSDNEVINVIPPTVTALLDCRLLPGQTTDDFLRKIRKKLDNEAIRIQVLHEGPPMNPSEKDHEFYTFLRESIEGNFPEAAVISIMQPNFNDLGRFRAKGITAFASNPVRVDRKVLSNIHYYNEHLPLSALVEGKAVYLDFIRRCMESARGNTDIVVSKRD